VVDDVVTSHTDLAPTFLSLAGADQRADFDGAAIPLTSSAIDQQQADNRREHVNVEYWGFALAEGNYGQQMFWNNTYKGLRLVGDGYNFYYSVWCSGEHELYDLSNDPYEIHNLYTSNHSLPFEVGTRASGSVATSETVTLQGLLSRLDALLLVLKTCKARACTHPWEVLHPLGDVKDLHGALRSEYDDFYEIQQHRVSFSKCEKGYILDSEGPTGVKSYAAIEDIGARGGSRWSELV